jgi:hypothetical protein
VSLDEPELLPATDDLSASAFTDVTLTEVTQ